MSRTSRPDPEALDRILRAQFAVIARDQALAAGVTVGALRHRLRPGGPWQSLLPGVHMAQTGTPTYLQQEMAALLHAGRGSVITGPAALRQYEIRGTLAEFIDVLIPASRRRRDARFARLHRTTRMPAQVTRLGPLRYALPARAVADAVRHLDSLRDVRAVVADAIQHSRCTVRDLHEELAKGPNAGAALFREALSDVADGIRSAAEGDLKDLLRKSGLPMPLFNPALYDSTGAFIARPDAWWPRYGIAVEVDSHQWHMSPQDHADTLARGRRLARHQIIVLRFTPKQIRAEPAKVIREIREALTTARGRPRLNLRTVPADGQSGAA